MEIEINKIYKLVEELDCWESNLQNQINYWVDGIKENRSPAFIFRKLIKNSIVILTKKRTGIVNPTVFGAYNCFEFFSISENKLFCWWFKSADKYLYKYFKEI